jgi:MarR family transcriptional repressor of emrRAB
VKGSERLLQVDISTPRMEKALPELPMARTVMVRLLRISVFGMGNFFEPVLRAMDLNENSFHVLCLLVAAEGGSESPGDLSEMVGTSRANIKRIVDELVEDGLVTRATAVRDARRQIVTISAAGRRKVRDTVPRMAEPLQVGFSGLDEAELAELNRLLRKLIVSFDNSVQRLRAAA